MLYSIRRVRAEENRREEVAAPLHPDQEELEVVLASPVQTSQALVPQPTPHLQSSPVTLWCTVADILMEVAQMENIHQH